MRLFRKLPVLIGIILIIPIIFASFAYATESTAENAESGTESGTENAIENESANRTGVVYVRELNLRTGSGTSYDIIECLGNGDILKILEQDGDWYRVTAPGGNTGWVYGAYVSLIQDSSEPATGNSSGVVNAQKLNLRSGPDTSYGILESLGNGDMLEIIKLDGDWYSVTAPSGKTGWVYGAYVSLEQEGSGPGAATRSAVINAQRLNLRTGPGTSYKILECLRYSNRVEFLEQDGDWCKVTAASGNTGWVYGRYLTLDSAISRSGIRTSEIVDYAKSFLGVKYVWGSSSPSGFDCSGFVKYVFSHFRITLYRTSSDQAAQGIWVSKADLRPSDLVFFDTDGGHNDITHAGIYVGDGMFIHSSTSHGKVVISSLVEGVYSGLFMTARRVVD